MSSSSDSGDTAAVMLSNIRDNLGTTDEWDIEDYRDFYGRDVPFLISLTDSLRARIAELERERDHWKANHDNQVALKAAVLNRPDLGDRAKSVQRIADRIAELEAALSQEEYTSSARAERIKELEGRVAKLEDAIRSHRDQRGDNRCWMDDEALYNALPEGFLPLPRDSRVELKNCERYIASRHNPGTEYVSPQERIEELERENAELHGKLQRALWPEMDYTPEEIQNYVMSYMTERTSPRERSFIAVDIVDRIGCDMSDVENAIAELVEAGKLYHDESDMVGLRRNAGPLGGVDAAVQDAGE